MGLNVNVTESNTVTNLGGQIAPFALMSDNAYIDMLPWSDGTSETHGVLYPTNFDTDTQDIIDANNASVGAFYSQDDNVYAASEVKRKVLGNYFNKYVGIQNITVNQQPPALGDSAGTMDSSPYPDKNTIQLDSNKLLMVYQDSSVVKAEVIEFSGTDTITRGTAVTMSSGNPAGDYAIMVTKVSATKAVVAWRESNVIKANVISVSGTVITAGTQSDIISDCGTGTYDFMGLTMAALDTFVVGYLNSSDHAKAVAFDISGTAINSVGTAITVVASTMQTTVFNTSNDVMRVSDTRVIFSFRNSSSIVYNYLLGVSGTTLTSEDNTTFSFSSSIYKTFHYNDEAVLMVHQATTPSPSGVRMTAVYYDSTGDTVEYVQIAGGTDISTSPRSLEDLGDGKFAVYSSNGTVSLGSYSNGTLSYGEQIEYDEDGINYYFFTDDYVFAYESTTLYGIKQKSGDVTINVNGTDVVTGEAIDTYTATVNLNVAIGGRKAYLSIENEEAFERTLKILQVIANVE